MAIAASVFLSCVSGCSHSEDTVAAPATMPAAAAAVGSSPIRQAQVAQQVEMGKRHQLLMQQAQARSGVPKPN